MKDHPRQVPEHVLETEPGRRDPDPPGGDGRGPGDDGPDEEIPFGQRFYDSPFVLLILGLLIMFVFYTGWGLWEVLSLPPAPLP